MEAMVVLGLILLNGFFAMAEIALVTARRTRLSTMVEKGDKTAEVALRLSEEPTLFLSTLQIGITAIGVLNGIVGHAAFSGHLASWLEGWGFGGQVSTGVATAVVVGGITYVTIVVGELVPKRIAQSNSEGVARLVARPIAGLAKLSRPLVFLLSVTTDGILRLLGKRELSSANLTEEDIYAMLVEGSQAGVIEEHEHQMVRNVFRLDDRQIISLMTPRSEMVYLDLEEPFAKSLERLLASEHSRFPVCRGSLREVEGVISSKRLLRLHLEGETEDLRPYLLEPIYVPETMTGMQLLEEFRGSGRQMVFVIDEYGEVVGLVTLRDLLEALAGEFTRRDPEDVWAVQRKDGSWLFDGLIPIPELKDRLDLKAAPEEERGQYHTLAGMVMWLMGQVPRTGDMTRWEGWVFEVVDLDQNRIDKVMVYRDDEGEKG